MAAATIISRSPADTVALGRQVAAEVREGEVIALAGELGAGKTQFVKGLAEGLGHRDAVTSPTFTLIHEYRGGRLPLYHFDFYRAVNEDEILRLGFDDYLRNDGVLVIEWADKFPAILPARTRWFHFRFAADDLREITQS
jgi:tRNA threonylcarbamoyladenosine biosynthesis protein TsaE